jgi:hypothetical protein
VEWVPSQKLSSIGFKASVISDCVFYCNDVIFMVYIDDSIFLGKNNAKLKDIIREIQETDLNIKDQGHPAYYARVNIKKMQDSS